MLEAKTVLEYEISEKNSSAANLQQHLNSNSTEAGNLWGSARHRRRVQARHQEPYVEGPEFGQETAPGRIMNKNLFIIIHIGRAAL